MYAVGLMSGTSLDGIDAALVEIDNFGKKTKIKLIEFITTSIPLDVKDEIKRACSEEQSSVDLICSLNFKLGYLFAEATKNVCNKAGITLENLDFIASHGQTIYHLPKSRDSFIPSTLQIGEPAIIAYETGVKVVSNFRVMDMASGGEGAPLVPYSEYIIYGSDEENIALQNIGGIGNVTVIPKGGDINSIFAFDTGPGNMIIDEVCQRLFKLNYDEDGKIAANGEIQNDILDDLMSHSYINAFPPKTTGREEFGQQFVDELLKKYNNKKPEDILSTVTMFTAKSIAVNYKNFIMNKVNLNKVIIGGGGAHNKTLLSYLKNELPNVSIVTQDDIGLSSDAKEAIAFVILGNETLNNNFSNVPSATGAKEKVILGNITPNPIRRV
ncbi:anhydro-N-acetylmuramic acid kinase AnmK [Clostridium celatum]|uniref:Anhydro-N-acetylmuramic acid kinase n=1 Tax=Clostridium celatum DSM 1785 TaxID=545697 RepID=L1QKW2_9CLOT|nr:anhydro-N-acetylmuramic acid kinase AnmK [Clostridium celatum]EKY28618.1 anhydro-N-acetylmuramic acid kinase [Clostridium celatum DSM 1785]MCE9654916.1 anhydro-N-acetylmuramic acid kinase [Clostridium celatum]MDU2265348.1 anhydro-N-acetylmuramic acid kinase AnmK [Clostridium celatum]MDU6294980.1 anhydro-N-acetylmuramic acid kinase AnmK [Clostridium celatum]